MPGWDRPGKSTPIKDFERLTNLGDLNVYIRFKYPRSVIGSLKGDQQALKKYDRAWFNKTRSRRRKHRLFIWTMFEAGK